MKDGDDSQRPIGLIVDLTSYLQMEIMVIQYVTRMCNARNYIDIFGLEETENKRK